MKSLNSIPVTKQRWFVALIAFVVYTLMFVLFLLINGCTTVDDKMNKVRNGTTMIVTELPTNAYHEFVAVDSNNVVWYYYTGSNENEYAVKLNNKCK